MLKSLLSTFTHITYTERKGYRYRDFAGLSEVNSVVISLLSLLPLPVLKMLLWNYVRRRYFSSREWKQITNIEHNYDVSILSLINLSRTF